MLRPRRLRSRVPASHQNRASASIWSPQNPESMPQDSLTHTQLGIPDSTPPESALALAFLLPTIFIAVFFGSTLAVASSFASALAAAYVIYPPQLSIWIHDPTHVAELGFIVLLAITASKAVGVIIDGKPLGSSGGRAASWRM